MTSLKHSPGICPKCGNPTDTNSKYCEYCAADLSEIRKQVQQTKQTQQIRQAQNENNESSEAEALKKRYWDAYTVARITVGIGTAIKVVGALLGILIFLGVLFFVNDEPRSYRRSDAQVIAIILGGMLGLLVLVFFFIWGVLVAVQGQILKASLDGAVNSSPFLTNKQRAKIMSL